MKPIYIVVLALLASSMAFTLYAFTGAIAPHVTIEQAMKATDRVVQVPGIIDKATVQYDGAKGQLKFEIYHADRKGNSDPSKRITVVYRQAMPENFKDATSVEAIGKFKDGVFLADNLLVKCPSKYSDDEKSYAPAGYQVPVKP